MMSGMRLNDISQEFVPSVLVLTIPFLVIWKYQDMTCAAVIVNGIDDEDVIHPPFGRLRRTSGWFGHHGKTSWELTCNDTNLEQF